MLFQLTQLRQLLLFASVLCVACVNTNMYDGPVREDSEIAIVISGASFNDIKGKSQNKDINTRFLMDTQIMSVLNNKTNDLRELTGMSAKGKTYLVKCLPGSYRINTKTRIYSTRSKLLFVESYEEFELEAGYVYSITYEVTSFIDNAELKTTGNNIYKSDLMSGGTVGKKLGTIEEYRDYLAKYY